MRLHVGMIAPENFFESVAREVLHDVDKFTAAVIALAGIALRILVGEVAPHRRHNGGRDDIFARDEFEISSLAREFLLHRLADFGVGISDSGKIDHAFLPFLNVFFSIITESARDCKKMFGFFLNKRQKYARRPNLRAARTKRLTDFVRGRISAQRREHSRGCSPQVRRS